MPKCTYTFYIVLSVMRKVEMKFYFCLPLPEGYQGAPRLPLQVTLTVKVEKSQVVSDMKPHLHFVVA